MTELNDSYASKAKCDLGNPIDGYCGAPWPLLDDAMMLAEQRTASFADIFRSEIDAATYRLESQGFRIWFTCEVDGVEYRLAARKPREPSASAAKCGLNNPRCERPINCRECNPWLRM